MICHRRFTDSQVDNFAECVGERCALWDEGLEECGDVVQIMVLHRIADSLEDIFQIWEIISRTLYEIRR